MAGPLSNTSDGVGAQDTSQSGDALFTQTSVSTVTKTSLSSEQPVRGGHGRRRRVQLLQRGLQERPEQCADQPGVLHAKLQPDRGDRLRREQRRHLDQHRRPGVPGVREREQLRPVRQQRFDPDRPEQRLGDGRGDGRRLLLRRGPLRRGGRRDAGLEPDQRQLLRLVRRRLHDDADQHRHDERGRGQRPGRRGRQPRLLPHLGGHARRQRQQRLVRVVQRHLRADQHADADAAGLVRRLLLRAGQLRQRQRRLRQRGVVGRRRGRGHGPAAHGQLVHADGQPVPGQRRQQPRRQHGDRPTRPDAAVQQQLRPVHDHRHGPVRQRHRHGLHVQRHVGVRGRLGTGRPASP